MFPLPILYDGAGNIIVDAERLTFCDSSGLRILVEIANDLRPSGGRVAIIKAQPIVLRVLELTGLDRAILINRDLTDDR